MKDCKAIQYRYYLELISYEWEFIMDWVDINSDISIENYQVVKKIIVVYYSLL